MDGTPDLIGSWANMKTKEMTTEVIEAGNVKTEAVSEWFANLPPEQQQFAFELWSPRNLEAEDRLADRFILGVEESLGFRFVLRSETDLLAGGRIFVIENASAAEQGKPLIHIRAMNRAPFQKHRVKAASASFSEVVSSSGEFSKSTPVY